MRQYAGRGVQGGLWIAVSLLAQGVAMAQTQPWNGPPPAGPAAQGPMQGPVQGPTVPPPYPLTTPYPSTQGSYPAAAGPRPDQVVGPQLPTLERRGPRVEQPPAPPPLSPQEQADVDRTLENWEQRSKVIRSYKCKFVRWEYDAIFSDPKKPGEAKYTDTGTIMFAAPDKGLFKVEGDHGERAEQWICDGKSVFEYNTPKKQLIEHPLPPDLQGKAIADGPLPFLFGAEAQKLKQRYYLRVITPPNAQGEIWLEAHPRFQKDAANFSKAHLILQAKGMIPAALQIYSPNRQDRTVYKFEDTVINDPWQVLEGNPFRASKPFGWTKVVDQPQLPPQANRALSGPR